MSWSPEFIAALSTAAVSFVAAIGSTVVAVIQAIHLSHEKDKLKAQMEAAKERETYAICPRCHEKVALRDLEFHLPDGHLDMDLDGKAD